MTTGPAHWPRLDDPQLTLEGPNGPHSSLYGDGYASAAGAAEETRLVFLDAIGAPAVWRDRRTFAIGETGFGLGLNFLLTWALWRDTAPADAHLHYVSIEGHPLTRAQLADALAPYAEKTGRTALVGELVRRYPVRHAGYHRLVLDGGRVRLTLLFGPAGEMPDGLRGTFDAWFLDGFSPSKNPDMWTADVLDAVARRTRPGGTVATYTAAGAVRRALTDGGFTMEKRPGYAGKRERLVGLKGDDDPPPAAAPWFAPPRPLRIGARVAVVGAGIAGQWLSRVLNQRGIAATLFDAAGREGGMTGNPAAMLIPKLHLKPTPPGRFQASAFLHALRSYTELDTDCWLSPKGARLALADTDRLEGTVSALDWPEEILRLETVRGRTVQFFPTAGCLDTERVKQALAPDIQTAAIARIERADGVWRLSDDDGNPVWEGDAVIVAAGGWSGRLLDCPDLGIRPSRGQVGFIGNGGPDLPDGAVSADGYLTPPVTLPDGSVGRILGSTFDAVRKPDEDDGWRQWSSADHARYADPMAATLDTPLPDPVGGWVGLRATTADKLPVAGPVPDTGAYRAAYADLRHGNRFASFPGAPYREGLFILSGLGARGYMFAPLMAELLADMMTGTPAALPADLIDAVHPARFLIRALRRNENAR